MPRNTREWAQRKIDSAKNTINWTGTHLEDIIKKYAPNHPEIAIPLAKAQLVLEELQIMLESVKKSF